MIVDICRLHVNSERVHEGALAAACSPEGFQDHQVADGLDDIQWQLILFAVHIEMAWGSIAMAQPPSMSMKCVLLPNYVVAQMNRSPLEPQLESWSDPS